MAANSHRWLDRALRWQARVASLAIAVFIALAAGGLRFGLTAQITVLLAGIVLVGFPHGAFDHLVARPVLAPRLGRFWWVPFGLAYLGLAGLVWLAWMLAPLPTLVLFLAGSVLHFGLGDIEDGLAPGSLPRWVAVLTYGALPILLPVAFHPLQAAPLLAAIGGVAAQPMEAALSLCLWLVPLWGAAFVWLCVKAEPQSARVVPAAITAAGFVLLPPLLAFGLYFGLVHSPRHLLRLGAWHDPADPRRAARWAARVVVPASLVCALGIIGIALTTQNVSIGLLVPTFRIIAALTLPHMIVTSWLGAAARRTSGGGNRSSPTFFRLRPIIVARKE
jgi:Brp/Blh family beta-carotene 15,15'-monooxygenase